MVHHDNQWEKIIHVAVFAHNTKATIGVMPFETWMGRRARLPIDLVIPTPGYRFETENK